METSGQEVGRIETRLRQLGTRLDRLVAQADVVGNEVKLDYRKQIEHAKEKQTLVRDKLNAGGPSMNEAFEFLKRDRATDARVTTDNSALAEEAELATSEPPQEVVTREAYEAEFESYRNRVLKDMDEREVRARETILLDFLEVADNLERAIAAWKKGGAKGLKSVKDGIDSVLRLFRSKLDRYAVTAIEAEGKPFDPHLHHAVSQAISADAIPGTVLHEVQKGYRMDGRLLRPAAVVVATAPALEVGTSNDVGGSGGESGGEWHGYQRNRR